MQLQCRVEVHGFYMALGNFANFSFAGRVFIPQEHFQRSVLQYVCVRFVLQQSLRDTLCDTAEECGKLW